MAASGYSGTPLVTKIGIKPGHRVRFPHRPVDWDLPGLPDGTVVDDAPDATPGAATPAADVTVAFYRSHADLAAEAAGLTEDLADHAMLWIAWPRRAAGHASDITENDLRDLFLPLGVVDVKVAVRIGRAST